MTSYFSTEHGVLYHGNCLEILPDLPQVDLVFTDPPYGHNNNNGDLISRREACFSGGTYDPDVNDRPIANDGKEANELFVDFLKHVKPVLKPGCCCCCCGGGGPDPQFARWSLWLDEILGFKHMVIWDKGPMGMGFHYRRSYETVLISEPVGGGKCNWYDTSKRVENIIRPGTGAGKILPLKSQHPTEKPWGLAAYFIRLHTKVGDTVLDPFAGGGSTFVACEKLDRKWIGIEIDEKYCEMIAKKIIEETRQMSLI